MLLWKALSTHSGVVAQEPYRKGLAYNTRIAADARQAALGWSALLDIEAKGLVALTLVDATGRPVSELDLRGILGRPSSNNADVSLAFAEQEPGRYVATADPIAAGAWRIDIEARSLAGSGPADQPVYRMRRRLWLKP